MLKILLLGLITLQNVLSTTTTTFTVPLKTGATVYNFVKPTTPNSIMSINTSASFAVVLYTAQTLFSINGNSGGGGPNGRIILTMSNYTSSGNVTFSAGTLAVQRASGTALFNGATSLGTINLNTNGITLPSPLPRTANNTWNTTFSIVASGVTVTAVPGSGTPLSIGTITITFS